MKRLTFGMIAILIISGLLSAYIYQQIQLKLASENTMPLAVSAKQQTLDEFLKQYNATGDIALAYKIAYENPQNVLSQVKCYCGCIKNNGHKNNLDCFMNEDGSFDFMGLNCGLCVKTAITSKQMLDEGKSVQEISDHVDERWGKEI
jgi:hypothetical protein